MTFKQSLVFRACCLFILLMLQACAIRIVDTGSSDVDVLQPSQLSLPTHVEVFWGADLQDSFLAHSAVFSAGIIDAVHGHAGYHVGVDKSQAYSLLVEFYQFDSTTQIRRVGLQYPAVCDVEMSIRANTVQIRITGTG